MLEAAISVLLDRQQEQVPIQVLRFAEKIGLRLTQLREVMTYPRHIESSMPIDRNCMRDAGNLELAYMDITHFDWVID